MGNKLRANELSWDLGHDEFQRDMQPLREPNMMTLQQKRQILPIYKTIMYSENLNITIQNINIFKLYACLFMNVKI